MTTPQATSSRISAFRAEYPVLARQLKGQPVVYFDSAATALKPRAVIDTMADFLRENGANVHRGIHALSQEASERFETAREVIAAFAGADTDEIVFVRNTTEAINIVAHSLPAGSKVLTTGMEHHSNVLPWRHFHDVTVVPLHPDGSLNEERIFEEIRGGGYQLVAVCHVSNVLGVVNPVREIVAAAHEAGAQVLIDGAQGAPHFEIDFQSLGCDYYAWSGHKLGGPTGIGALCARRERLAALRPLLWGGNMVSAVHIEGETLQEGPLRFEAGTPPIEAVLALAAACDFLDDVGLDAVLEHDRALAAHARAGLGAIDRMILHGPTDPQKTIGICTFSIDGIPANMVAKVLSDRANVFVRSGFLCSQPLHERLGIEPSVRASFYLYNTTEEVDLMLGILQDLVATA